MSTIPNHYDGASLELSILDLCTETRTFNFVSTKVSTRALLGDVVSSLTGRDRKTLSTSIWISTVTDAIRPSTLSAPIEDIRFRNTSVATEGSNIPQNMLILIPKSVILNNYDMMDSNIMVTTTDPHTHLKNASLIKSAADCLQILPMINTLSKMMIRLFLPLDVEESHRSMRMCIETSNIISKLLSSSKNDVDDVYARASKVTCETNGLCWTDMFDGEQMLENMATLSTILADPDGIFAPVWKMEKYVHPHIPDTIVAKMTRHMTRFIRLCARSTPESTTASRLDATSKAIAVHNHIVMFLNHTLVGMSWAYHDLKMSRERGTEIRRNNAILLDYERLSMAQELSALFSKEMKSLGILKDQTTYFSRHTRLLPPRLYLLYTSELEKHSSWYCPTRDENQGLYHSVKVEQSTVSICESSSVVRRVIHDNNNLLDILQRERLLWSSGAEKNAAELGASKSQVESLYSASTLAKQKGDERISAMKLQLEEIMSEVAHQAHMSSVKISSYESQISSLTTQLASARRALLTAQAKSNAEVERIEDQLSNEVAKNLNLQDRLDEVDKR